MPVTIETTVEVGGWSRTVEGIEDELMVLRGAIVTTGLGAVGAGFVLVGAGFESLSSSSSSLLELVEEEPLVDVFVLVLEGLLLLDFDSVFAVLLVGLLLDFDSVFAALLEELLEELLLLELELPLGFDPLLLGELEFVVALSALYAEAKNSELKIEMIKFKLFPLDIVTEATIRHTRRRTKVKCELFSEFSF